MRIAKRPLLLGLSSLAILSLVVAAVVTFGARNASAASIGFPNYPTDTRRPRLTQRRPDGDQLHHPA